MQGVNDGGQNQNSDFTTTANTGCRWYGTTGAPGAGRKWRVPTQRELQLMWMFREAIGANIRTTQWKNPTRRKYTGLPLKRVQQMLGFLSLHQVCLTVIPKLKLQRMVW